MRTKSYDSRTVSPDDRRGPPSGSARGEFRRAIVALVAVLGTFCSALLLEGISRQHLPLVIFSIVLALTLSRLRQGSGRLRRSFDVVVLLVVALAAGTLGQLLLQHPGIGGAAFVVAVSGSMWIRQYGGRVARVGQILLLPLTSILVIPAIGAYEGPDTRLWQVAAALLALGWVLAVQSVARRLGFVSAVRPGAPATASGRPPKTRKLSGHARMAIQLAAALTAALVVGHVAFPGHWNWTMLTATIVCGGGPGRGEVLYKGMLRLLGAGTGTVIATLVSSQLPGHHDGTVVLIFGLLFLGTWWREINYAIWAATVTCVMALLDTYLGQSGIGSLLTARLSAIAVGAMCAVLACTCILPTSTTAMVRLRRSTTLQSLSALVDTTAAPPSDLHDRLEHLEAQIRQLRQSVWLLHMHRVLLGRFRTVDTDLLTSVDAVLIRASAARTYDYAISESPSPVRPLPSEPTSPVTGESPGSVPSRPTDAV
jgi:hypothetical protein